MTENVDVSSAVDRTAAVMTAVAIRHAFGGAIAQNYWGTVRATQDVDLLALVPALESQKLVDALTANGFVMRDVAGRPLPIDVASLRPGIEREGLFVVWFGLVKVEIFSPVIPLQSLILDRAVPMPWRDRMIPVTTAEDLILLKMVFHREKDLRDIRGIVATRGHLLDLTYLEAQAVPALDAGRRDELRRLLDPARPPQASG